MRAIAETLPGAALVTGVTQVGRLHAKLVGALPTRGHRVARLR